MEYVNKAEMHGLLVEYQALTDDLDTTWLIKYKSHPKRKMTKEVKELWFKERDEFKIFKAQQIKDRATRLEIETPEDFKIREKRLKQVKEEIGTMFCLIVKGALTLSEFNSREINIAPLLKSDMYTDATWTMYNYIDRFDCRRENPFAYFTEMAKNAARQRRDKFFSNRMRNPSLEFLENMDGGELESTLILAPIHDPSFDKGI